MIPWLGILKGVISLGELIAKICHDKQLITAGEYKAIAENTTKTLERIILANAARSADSVPEHDDPDNRNNRH